LYYKNVNFKLLNWTADRFTPANESRLSIRLVFLHIAESSRLMEHVSNCWVEVRLAVILKFYTTMHICCWFQKLLYTYINGNGNLACGLHIMLAKHDRTFTCGQVCGIYGVCL